MTILSAVAALPLIFAGPAPASASPLPGPLVTEFDNPPKDWLPGHRGIDLAGLSGQRVVAAADGVVTFAGQVAGKPVVVVSHGEVRTTYEPVDASVVVGARVREGATIGTLAAGHEGCPVAACLHLGLKRGEEYLDPTRFLIPSDDVRLVGDDWSPPPSVPPLPAPATGSAGDVGPFQRPPGRVTSPFGMRFHPVLKVWALHSGADFGLSCGTPVPAIGAGTVVFAGWKTSGTGYTVVIDHGGGITSLYGHASSLSVQTGDRVARGQTVARVGSTGFSTGCHLHLGLRRGSVPIDPLPHLR